MPQEISAAPKETAKQWWDRVRKTAKVEPCAESWMHAGFNINGVRFHAYELEQSDHTE